MMMQTNITQSYIPIFTWDTVPDVMVGFAAHEFAPTLPDIIKVPPKRVLPVNLSYK